MKLVKLELMSFTDELQYILDHCFIHLVTSEPLRSLSLSIYIHSILHIHTVRIQ